MLAILDSSVGFAVAKLSTIGGSCADLRSAVIGFVTKFAPGRDNGISRLTFSALSLSCSFHRVYLAGIPFGWLYEVTRFCMETERGEVAENRRDPDPRVVLDAYLQDVATAVTAGAFRERAGSGVE